MFERFENRAGAVEKSATFSGNRDLALGAGQTGFVDSVGDFRLVPAPLPALRIDGER